MKTVVIRDSDVLMMQLVSLQHNNGAVFLFTGKIMFRLTALCSKSYHFYACQGPAINFFSPINF